MWLAKGTWLFFWEDKWCEVRPQKEVFHDIYCMEVSSNRVLWSPILRKDVFDWELPSLYDLLERLSIMPTVSGQPDQRI